MGNNKAQPKIRLWADRLLVKVLPMEDTKLSSGIILPTVGKDESKICKRGEVILIASKIEEHLEEDSVEIGEVVLFSQYAGSDIEFSAEEYKILRVTDIFGVDEM